MNDCLMTLHDGSGISTSGVASQQQTYDQQGAPTDNGTIHRTHTTNTYFIIHILLLGQQPNHIQHHIHHQKLLPQL